MKEKLKYFFHTIGLNKNYDVWEYGTCNNSIARKHKINGNVQFVLWKAGEQGHKKDSWYNFDSSWWIQFKKNNSNNDVII